MATEIVMPNLGFAVEQARIIEWLKQPGDAVRVGEILAIVESDKANVELESVAGGVLLEVLVTAGAEAAVGAVIARVGQPGELRQAAPVVAPAAVTSGETQRMVEASPIARKLAEENKIDLATLTGSGPRGRITREDVEAAIQQQGQPELAGAARNAVLALPKVRKAVREAGVALTAVPATGPNGVTSMADLQRYLQASQPQAAATAAPLAPRSSPLTGAKTIPLSKVRQIIGQRMSESKRSAPHFYVTGEFDLEQALQRLNSLPEPRPGLNVLIQYLTVRTLRRVPALNAIYQDETIYQFDAINLAVAVAREEGLITPVLHGAERFSLEGLAQETRKLVERARSNKLHPDDLQSATFTISNLGVIPQVDQFVAIINPPQVAILAVGTVKPRPVVLNGGLHIRHTVHLTLSGDHRAVDGMDLAQFMAAFQNELENFASQK